MNNRVIWAFIFLLSLWAFPASAQTGTISGTVTDSTGAVVPNATVRADNTATGLTRTTQTTGAGTYSFPNLQPGIYNINVEATGFSASRFTALTLTVAQTLSLNVVLSPGQVTETVEVSGAGAPTIELTNAQISNVITSQMMVDLPLLTRNPYDLVLLSPGTLQSNSSLGGFSVNGSRERNNNFLLDGIDNNDTSVPGIPGGIVGSNPDATQEFRVITNNFLPEYGRNTGAVIEVITRSGTNDFRGNAYWFGRYNALAARDTFNPRDTPQNPFVRNMFGFSFGGPIIKDRTFFFSNTEWQRYRTTVTKTSVVPTAAFRTGRFTYQGFNVNLADPNSPNNPLRLPIDPTVQRVLALLPLPNGEAVDDVRGIYRFPSSSRQDTASQNFKLDHRFTQNHSFFARYTYNGAQDPNLFYDEFAPGFGTIGFQSQAHSIATNLTSVLTPTTVNEFRAGVNRTDAPFSCSGVGTLDAIRRTDAFGAGTDYTISGITNSANRTGIGCAGLGASVGQARRTGTWMLTDSLSKVISSHSVKAGFEYRRVFENGYSAFGSRPTLDLRYFTNTGSPVIDIDPSRPCRSAGGAFCDDLQMQDLAAALLGLAATQTQSQYFNSQEQRTATDFRQFRQNEMGGYFQDVWRVRPNLTLTMGTRYQFYGVPYETNNNLSNLFQNPAGAAPFTFTLVGPGTNNQLFNDDWNNIEPRFGFSWDPFGQGKTAVRGGYGIFHDRVFGNLFGNARGNPPFQQDSFEFYEQPVGGVASVPLPATLTPSLIVEEGAFIGPLLFDRDIRNPISQNWNFGVQHELLNQFTVDVAYVASKANRLFRSVDGNPPQPALIQQRLAEGIAPTALQNIALYTAYEAANNTAFLQPTINKTIANSNYHSLQLNVRRRYSNGVHVQGAYTWAHAIDDASDPLSATASNRSFPRNSRDLRQERGNSGFDVRHRLVMNYVVELPFGRNRVWLRSGLASHVLGGWEVTGISAWQSGLPFEIFGNRDNQHAGVTNRVDFIGDPSIPENGPRNLIGPSRSAFALAPFGVDRAPTLGRNLFRGQSIINTDLMLIKNTSFSENVRAQLRIETYNLFNRPQYTTPGNLYQNPLTFGLATSTVVRPDGTTSNRQIQLALKLYF